MSTQPLHLDGKKTALLVVHMQPDIVSAHTAFGAMFNTQVVERDIVAQTKRAMDSVRSAGGLIIPLRIAFRPDYSDAASSIPLLAMAQGAGSLQDGSLEADILPELEVQPKDLVFTHKRPGPFTGSNLQQVLDGEGITNVVVCGVATNASVEGSVRQASDLGYNTFVLEDASSAADLDTHNAAIASMGLFGQAVSVAELQDALQN